jgi:hypothetical protein
MQPTSFSSARALRRSRLAAWALQAARVLRWGQPLPGDEHPLLAEAESPADAPEKTALRLERMPQHQDFGSELHVLQRVLLRLLVTGEGI